MTWAIWAVLFAGFQVGLGCLIGSFIKRGMDGEQPATVRAQSRTVRNHEQQ